MIKYLFYLLSLFLLISCGNKSKKEKSPNNETKIIELGTFSSDVDLKECACNELKKDSNEVYHLDEVPFTGRCFSNYPKTEKKYMEMSIQEGLLHGFFMVYDKSGNVLTKERYHKGEKLDKVPGNNEKVLCMCDSLIKEKLTFGERYIYKYKNLPFTGICYDYYPNSEIKYMESEYLNGMPHGLLNIYDKSEKLISQEKYEMGEKVTP